MENGKHRERGKMKGEKEEKKGKKTKKGTKNSCGTFDIPNVYSCLKNEKHLSKYNSQCSKLQ